MRLIDLFDRGYTLNPDGDCLIQGTEKLTYREVWRASHRIANRLRSLDLGDEAAIAMLSNNHLYTMVAVLGILRSGYVWLPLNTRFASDEVEHALRIHEARFIFYHSDFSKDLLPLLDTLPSLRGSAVIDDSSGTLTSVLHWMNESDETLVDILQSPDTVVAIRSTSGTTGPSKGVLATNGVYATMFANFFSVLPITRRPVHLAAAPLSHAAGTLCFATMAFGGTSVILAKAVPEDILSAIEAHRITHVFVPPTLIYMLLDSRNISKHDYSSLQYLIYSAAPMSVERLKQALSVFGPVMAQTFGQAEAPFFCAILTPQDHVLEEGIQSRRLASCGRATPFTRLGIMDDDGKLLAPNEVGELVVRSGLVMKGYFRNPEATAAVSKYGWHHTGDMAYSDEDGYFYLVDRKRDLIISGGFNIFPGEVEQVLWSHPSVADCAVIGVPDEIWGESVKAVIELKPGSDANADELIALCRARLGSMKAPKSVDFWSLLPRSPNGKVLKKDIRSKYWSGHERKI